MPAARSRERIESDFCRALAERSGPADLIEYEIAAFAVTTVCEEHPESVHHEPMVLLWASLTTGGDDDVSVAHLTMPLARCSTGEVEGAAHRLWDALVVDRMAQNMNIGDAEGGVPDSP